jgi:hypothetical protein
MIFPGQVSLIIYYNNCSKYIMIKILYGKFSSEKILTCKGLEIFSRKFEDLNIFLEIFEKKKTAAKQPHVNFQWILIFSGCESHEIFMLDF